MGGQGGDGRKDFRRGAAAVGDEGGMSGMACAKLKGLREGGMQSWLPLKAQNHAGQGGQERQKSAQKLDGHVRASRSAPRGMVITDGAGEIAAAGEPQGEVKAIVLGWDSLRLEIFRGLQDMGKIEGIRAAFHSGQAFQPLAGGEILADKFLPGHLAEKEMMPQAQIADDWPNGINGAKPGVRIIMAAHAGLLVQQPGVRLSKKAQIAAACAAAVAGEAVYDARPPFFFFLALLFSEAPAGAESSLRTLCAFRSSSSRCNCSASSADSSKALAFCF